MIDPREVMVREKFATIKSIIPVVSGKGGVGKSIISTALSLALAEKYKTGLLDLDFWGASDHILLNTKNQFPEEERGILPEEVMGVRFMSVAYYTQGNPLPIRGMEYTNVFLELMAVTRWDDTECLVIDMPPGMADPFLDLLQYVRNGNFLIITTPSRLAVNIVAKTLEILKEQDLKIIGLMENMHTTEHNSKRISDLIESYKVKYLGYIPYYQNLDDHMDALQDFILTDFFQKIKMIGSCLEI
ncbi:MAG: P-loop NTPase [Atribacterota bacterium]|nr:P-loop NTPase [Atribacterota bacterium]MDD4895637.1 P-loop NTPase [Atribacterota bacterium]MDD5637045.1 P-loop NTPase [Atribacterota bacterium]